MANYTFLICLNTKGLCFDRFKSSDSIYLFLNAKNNIMSEFGRRTFLQQSAVLTSGIAMPGFIKMPVLEAGKFSK